MLKPFSVEQFEALQEPGGPSAERPGRKKRENGIEPAPAHVTREPRQLKGSPTILLTPERVSKLWNILCGGRLVIETDSDHGGIICHVSRDSFDSLLEGMIDRL